MGTKCTCLKVQSDSPRPHTPNTISSKVESPLISPVAMPGPDGKSSIPQKDSSSKPKNYTPIPSHIPIEFNDELLDLLPTNNCNLDQCSAMTRFKYILDHHDEELIEYGAYEFINNRLKKYNNIHLLDDYHHLMFVHEYEFEDIYNILTANSNGICNFNKCTSFTRNHRDRSSTIASKLQYDKFTTNDSKHDIKQNIKQVNTVQIIDQIHCYFLHTFDCHYRLKREEQLKLEEKIEEMHDIEIKDDDGKEHELSGSKNDEDDMPVAVRLRAYSRHKDSLVSQDNGQPNLRDRFSVTQRIRQKRDKYIQFARIVSSDGTTYHADDDELPAHRFGSRRNMGTIYSGEDILDVKETQSIDDDGNSVYGKENDIVYSFGVRFVYDKKEKDHEWYVKPTWDTLKDELVSNSYDAFGMEQWNELLQKAQNYRKSKRVKEDCEFKDTGDTVTSTRNKKKKHKNVMGIEHLMAIMLYCNFDKLQGVFTGSYRKNKGESNGDLKKKHSEWHQLGKYLREVVEIYGTKISSEERKLREKKKRGRTSVNDLCLDKSGKLKFYHGINQEMVFVSTTAKICGPLSTSSEPFVALNFAGTQGLLLELSGSNARFFDCCGISDYSNEKEKFFLGGYDALLIETVINPRTIDYRPYIQAMNIISCMFNGQQYYSISSNRFSKKTCERVYTLLFYNKLKDDKDADVEKLETYVEKLFNHYAQNVTEITIDWNLMNLDYDEFQPNTKGFSFIKHRLCMNTFNWIKMNRIVSLFKHLQIIQLNYINLTNKVLDYILSVLKKHQDDLVYNSLKKIIIYQPFQKKGFTIPDALAIYADKFRTEIRWRLYVQDKEQYSDLAICRITQK